MLRSEMKLLFLTNVPSPYMVDFFNELGQLCDLTVVFEKKTSSERDQSWQKFQFIDFKGIILKGLDTAVDAAFCPQIISYIVSNKYDHIIVSNPTTPTGIIAIEFMKARKIPYMLESEGGFAKNGKGLKEKIKKQIISGAKLYFSTTAKADEYFITYGARKDRIVKYPFTSLYKKDLLEIPVEMSEKLILREHLGIKGEKIAIAAGRFISLKNYNILIEAWKDINPNYTLCLIGGGPEKTKYQGIIEKYNMHNVHLLDFMGKEELFMYYKASDLFIHPTSSDVWGLVINEAMACGLPIITTDMCIAGLELISDYENGFVLSAGDVIGLVMKTEELLNNDELRTKMSERSLQKIQWYTLECMAKTHIEILTNNSKYSKDRKCTNIRTGKCISGGGFFADK